MPALTIPTESFFLDRDSPRSLQAQIRETIVSAIVSGQAPIGACLPSSRRLAEHLGVARMTVTLAYQELVALGFLNSENRRAYRVADSAPVSQLFDEQSAEDESSNLDWDDWLGESLIHRRRVEKPYDWRTFRYPFVYGQMDPGLFDHTAWRDCARQAMGRRDFGDMAGDMAISDDPVLVNYIRARTLPRRGISATPDTILVTVGAQNALWLAIALLSRRPLRAVCENPGYPDMRTALAWSGAEVETVDIDEHGLPPEKIPDGTQAVFVTPSHHAPTGTTMPRDRRRQLLTDAEARNFIVVEDDYEFEMSFLEPASRALKAHDRNDRVIYVGSFSKALFPGLRIGYMVGPRRVIAEARELRALILRHPPGHLQRTTAYFLAQGHYDAQIRAMRRHFAQRREIMQAALADTGLEIAGAARFGGSSLWIRGPAGLDATALSRDLLSDGVVIEPGTPFFTPPDAPTEYFRLGYSSIPADRIAAGIKLIARRVAMHCK